MNSKPDNESLLEKLPAPVRFFPAEKGKYEVAPNLRPLGTDFGNGPRDGFVFLFDNHFPIYRDNKLACRQEKLSKYFLTHEFSKNTEAAVCRFMAHQLSQEHPQLFFLNTPKTTSSSQIFSLQCHLTQEQIYFDEKFQLIRVDSKPKPIQYSSLFDALCAQLQGDVAITQLSTGESTERKDWLAALHLCSPSHWAAADKIGKNFIEVHQPVAGIEKVNAASKSLVDASIHKGPYIRFVWGFGTDNRLNHHPEAPPGWDKTAWKGRMFQPEIKENPFYLRMERQVLYGLPEVNASFFTIHVLFLSGEELKKNPIQCAQLKSSIESMDEAQLRYKGLYEVRQQVLAWLSQP